MCLSIRMSGFTSSQHNTADAMTKDQICNFFTLNRVFGECIILVLVELKIRGVILMAAVFVREETLFEGQTDKMPPCMSK